MRKDPIALAPKGVEGDRDGATHLQSSAVNEALSDRGSDPMADLAPGSGSMATRLARKRARDRRAQQAMRDRTKGELDTLKGQVAYLSHLLEFKETRVDLPDVQAAGYVDELAKLREENEHLRREVLQIQALNSSKLAVPRSTGTSNYSGLTIEPYILELWSSTLPGSSASRPNSSSGDKYSTQSHFVLSERHDMPLHVPPTCPADRIMQPFCEEQRRLLQSSGGNSASPGFEGDASATFAAVRTAISKVAADLLGTYIEIDTLPKRVACLYMISNVLNWYIFQTREVFEQMPFWLRPCPSQMEIPHPAWMDRVQWPRVRDYLVRHQNITFDEYTDAFSLSFDVNWPYDDSLVVIKEEVPASSAVRYRINPVFEEHIRNVRNWTVGPRYWQLYPLMGKAVEQDRLQFGT